MSRCHEKWCNKVDTQESFGVTKGISAHTRKVGGENVTRDDQLQAAES
ncbi:MAG: hypothetical protein ACO3EZ_13530 [Prochlorotrichaceae cyanobacterium]